MLRTLKNLAKFGAAFFKMAPLPRPTAREFLVIGHRGAAAEEVENTLASVKRAVEIDKVNALELDLTMTSDGELVLWHDWDPTDHISIARAQGLEPDVLAAPRFARHAKYLRPIHEITYPQFIANYGYKEKSRNGHPVGAFIPRMEQVLEYLRDKTSVQYVFWDIKTPKRGKWIIPKMMSRIYALLDEYNAHYRSVYLTPYIPIMEAMEAHRSQPNYMLDCEPPPGIILDPCKFTSSKMAIKYHNAFCNTIHPKAFTIGPWTQFKRIIECDLRTKAHHNAANPRVPIEKIVGATINARDEMECLIAMGIDGLMSDSPRLLRGVAEKLGMTIDLVKPIEQRSTITEAVEQPAPTHSDVIARRYQ